MAGSCHANHARVCRVAVQRLQSHSSLRYMSNRLCCDAFSGSKQQRNVQYTQSYTDGGWDRQQHQFLSLLFAVAPTPLTNFIFSTAYPSRPLPSFTDVDQPERWPCWEWNRAPNLSSCCSDSQRTATDIDEWQLYLRICCSNLSEVSTEVTVLFFQW